MNFASDNTGPAHPKVMEALMRANEGYAPAYGADALTTRAVNLVRETFEAPEAEVAFVATGTGCNSLLLAALSRPWETIFCGPLAHVRTDESNAPEAFSGGARLVGVDVTPRDKVTPEALEAAMGDFGFGDVHSPALGPVTITQATERGTLYSADEIAAIAGVAHANGVRLHMDGARFANAAVALGLSAADMSHRAGVDAVSFGGTKNGCLAVEAAVVFDPEAADHLKRRRMRAGHLFSKHRLLAAQMVAYLEGGLWRELAEASNAAAARLAKGLESVPGAAFEFPVEANMLWVWLPRAAHRRLKDAGAAYHIYVGELNGADPDEALLARLVCDWSCPDDAIDRFVEIAG